MSSGLQMEVPVNNTPKQNAEMEIGALNFFEKHPEIRISRCDANVSLLAGQIDPAKYLDPAAWEQAYKEVGRGLVPLAKKEPAPKPKPETWDYPFPQFKTVREIRRCPPDVYRQWYFDRSSKGEAFRNMVNNILDAEQGSQS